MRIRKLLILAALIPTLAVPAYHTPQSLDRKELKCMMDNIYHEARGESALGQMLVAKVVYNRAGLSGLCDTIYARKQFSWVGKVGGLKLSEHKYETMMYVFEAKGLNVAYKFYHANRIRPGWSKKSKGVVHGNHTFYSDLRK